MLGITFMLVTISVCFGNPVKEAASSAETNAVTASAPPNLEQTSTEFFDQRQNGTDNFRFKVSNVEFLMAPSELIMAGLIAGEKGLPKEEKKCEGEECLQNNSNRRKKVNTKAATVFQHFKERMIRKDQ